MLGHLEGLADRMGIRIRTERMPEEEIPLAGGLCRIEGRFVILLNAKTSRREKIRIVAAALNHFDLSEIYILPVVREILNAEKNSFTVAAGFAIPSQKTES